ncbi:hypothetical protein B0H14DRAFT_2666064 [Mycena olivaceomarginata]|nr:hypothetical protein B0H14DRAFT_2666064 [Mycena olivaceomarginata]
MPFNPPAFFSGACVGLVWLVFQDSIKNGANLMTASVLSFPFIAFFSATTRALDLFSLILIVMLAAGAEAVPKDDDDDVHFPGTFSIEDHIVEHTTALQELRELSTTAKATSPSLMNATSSVAQSPQGRTFGLWSRTASCLACLPIGTCSSCPLFTTCWFD